MPLCDVKTMNTLKTLLLNLALLAALLVSFGCSKKDPEAIRTTAVIESFDELSKCNKVSGAEHLANIALASVVNVQNDTVLKLVAYATNTPVEFPVPFYKLSAGRWLVGEKDRVYLMDEHCRGFELKDRRPPEGKKFSQDGILRLNPGESFEMTFSFYRLKETTRFGMLVYAGKVLPFVVNPSNAQPISKP